MPVSPPSWAMLGTLLFSGLNTAALLVAVWRIGHWTGTVDARLSSLEEAVRARREKRRTTDNL